MEISEEFFEDKYDSSYIMIYPFTLNIRRQYRYYRSIRRRYEAFSLNGLPYSIIRLVRVFSGYRNRDLHVIDFEREAYEKHGFELLSLGTKVLYTSDEFEAGSYAMCKVLSQHGIRIENVAHGLSFACAYTFYDMFKVYNTGQQEYYKLKAKSTQFHIFPRGFKRNQVRRNSSEKEKVIVFLDGNFQASNLQYENGLQEAVLAKLKIMADRYSVDVIIKAHPNLSMSQVNGLRNKFGIEVDTSANFLEKVAPIFVTIISAAYYDFKDLGPFIFVAEDIVDLSTFYGEQVNQVTLENLEDSLKGFLAASFDA